MGQGGRWEFWGQAGEVITITQQAVVGSLLDTYLALYGPDGEVVAENDDFDGYDSQIGAFQLRQTGTYTIHADGYIGTSGDYQLTLSAGGAEPANGSGSVVEDRENATITSATLNVRSGPGTAYGIVTKVKQGEVYPVLSRDGATGWVQISIDAVASGNGWVSGQYVSISSTTAPRAQPTSTQPSNGSAPQTLVTDFETFGTWRRGDESWGTFVQSTEQKQSGRNAGKFTYDFPAGEPNNYIVFRRTISIAGQPTALSLQVYGDSSTHFLNAWVQDARGQLWQFTFGRINHSGWRSMDAPLDLDAGWPNGAIGHSSTRITYPIKLYALTLDGYTSDRAFSGVVYVDDLEAITE